jgi:hypothetical protein
LRGTARTQGIPCRPTNQPAPVKEWNEGKADKRSKERDGRVEVAEEGRYVGPGEGDARQESHDQEVDLAGALVAPIPVMYADHEGRNDDESDARHVAAKRKLVAFLADRTEQVKRCRGSHAILRDEQVPTHDHAMVQGKPAKESIADEEPGKNK